MVNLQDAANESSASGSSTSSSNHTRRPPPIQMNMEQIKDDVLRALEVMRAEGSQRLNTSQTRRRERGREPGKERQRSDTASFRESSTIQSTHHGSRMRLIEEEIVDTGVQEKGKRSSPRKTSKSNKPEERKTARPFVPRAASTPLVGTERENEGDQSTPLRGSFSRPGPSRRIRPEDIPEVVPEEEVAPPEGTESDISSIRQFEREEVTSPTKSPKKTGRTRKAKQPERFRKPTAAPPLSQSVDSEEEPPPELESPLNASGEDEEESDEEGRIPPHVEPQIESAHTAVRQDVSKKRETPKKQLRKKVPQIGKAQKTKSISTTSSQPSTSQRQRASAKRPTTEAPRTSQKRKTRQNLLKQTFSVKMLKEIRNLQAASKFLVPRLPFSRVVRELTSSLSAGNLRYTPDALEALQTACEFYLTEVFTNASHVAHHAKRVTVMPKDLELLRTLKVIDV